MRLLTHRTFDLASSWAKWEPLGLKIGIWGIASCCVLLCYMHFNHDQGGGLTFNLTVV